MSVNIDTLSLEEKQAYYRYEVGAVVYKDPPKLPTDVAQALRAAGLDQKYRFLWCGVAVVRKSRHDENPIIRGDRRACVRSKRVAMVTDSGTSPLLLMADPTAFLKTLDWIDPAYPFIHAEQPDGYVYRNLEGHRVTCKRPDEVPSYVVTSKQIIETPMKYVSYGQLLWRIQKRLVGDELIESGLFAPGSGLPPEYWHTIDTLAGVNDSYIEPSMADVEYLKQRDYEDRHLSTAELTALVRKQAEERMKVKLADDDEKDRLARAAFDEVMADIEQYSDTRPVSSSAAVN